MAKPANEFYDLEKLSGWTVRLLYIGLALTVILSVSTWFELQLLQDMRAGNFESEEAMLEAAETNDRRQLVISIAEAAAYLVGGVFSLIWIYRSAHNARVHSANVKYRTGACVWWFFIPLLCLWEPHRAMTETFTLSVRQAGGKMERGGPLLGTWWTCWVISGICYYAIFRLAWDAKGLNTLINADRIILFVSAIDVAATLAFIVMIRKLGRILAHVRQHPPQAVVYSSVT